MKTSELKTGVAYVINNARDWEISSHESRNRGFFLAAGYNGWSRRSPHNSTHVAVLIQQTWPSFPKEEQTAEWYEAARHYTEQDFRNKVEPPKGWRVTSYRPSAIRCTWEAYQTIREQKLKERAEYNRKAEQRRREYDESYRLKQEARERISRFVAEAEAQGWDDVQHFVNHLGQETEFRMSDLKLILEN